MNKDRRKALKLIGELISQMNLGPIIEGMGSAHEDLEGLKTEEEEYLENMSENLKGGDKGTTAEEAISKMDDALEKLEAAKTALEELDEIDFDDFG